MLLRMSEANSVNSRDQRFVDYKARQAGKCGGSMLGCGCRSVWIKGLEVICLETCVWKSTICSFCKYQRISVFLSSITDSFQVVRFQS